MSSDEFIELFEDRRRDADLPEADVTVDLSPGWRTVSMDRIEAAEGPISVPVGSPWSFRTGGDDERR